jgi:excisionase family DNA binding protein
MIAATALHEVPQRETTLSETARVLLTPTEVAERLRLKVGTVYQYLRDGVLPAVNVGAPGKRPTWRVDEDALKQWMEERSVQPTPTPPPASSRPRKRTRKKQ